MASKVKCARKGGPLMCKEASFVFMMILVVVFSSFAIEDAEDNIVFEEQGVRLIINLN